MTGFLLAGVGNATGGVPDNFFVVEQYTAQAAVADAFKKYTTDPDISVLLISQVRSLFQHPRVCAESENAVAAAALVLTRMAREISPQDVAGTIRWLIDDFEAPVPAILEIPTKSKPYDPEQDPTYTRIKRLIGSADNN